MSDFSISKEKLEEISKRFNVKLETVDLIHNIFTKVTNGVKYQYLAHLIRCMESFIRSRTRNPMFQINCFPIDIETPVLNVGCAQYYPKRFFSIFFHPRMEEKQLRVCLAHELGHLFIVELLNGSNIHDDVVYDQKTMTEPLSSIFGIFAIMDKNASYEDRLRRLKHNSPEQILQDFIHLQDKVIN